MGTEPAQTRSSSVAAALVLPGAEQQGAGTLPPAPAPGRTPPPALTCPPDLEATSGSFTGCPGSLGCLSLVIIPALVCVQLTPTVGPRLRKGGDTCVPSSQLTPDSSLGGRAHPPGDWVTSVGRFLRAPCRVSGTATCAFLGILFSVPVTFLSDRAFSRVLLL